MKTKLNIKALLLLLTVLVVGVLIGRWTSNGSTTQSTEGIAQENTIWTCSMHPQIRQDEFGLCPICGMDLTPLDEEDGDSDLPMDALRMSPTAMQLANVHTMEVQAGDVSKEVRLAGRVALNPSQAFSQNAHFSGRVEEFYFNSLGEYVQKGNKIAVIYSPELLNTQKELLLAHQSKEAYPGMYEAVREKLKVWKISEAQIDEIVQNGKPTEQFPIYANQSGYLVQKMVERGDYVEGGMPLFTLSQLNSLWGVFDVYEKDAAFVKKGMEIAYSLPSMPGQTFETIVDFVEPILNAETRTLTARILINNPKLDFKPEMLINGFVQSELSLGTDKIVVPKSAVMWTGKHSIVYVKHETDKHVGFQMRPVTLGAALGDSYVVEDGLKIGEEIVVEGTFSVDAAAQLANKPSMMNYVNPHADGLALPKIELNDNQKKLFKPLFQQYFVVKDALVGDDFEGAKTAYVKLTHDWQHTDWSAMPKELQKPLAEAGKKSFLNEKDIYSVGTIDPLRNKQFYGLSNFFIDILNTYGPFENTMYVQHCPMANKDKGADWLSMETQVLNPYYGASMLKCGEVRESY